MTGIILYLTMNLVLMTLSIWATKYHKRLKWQRTSKKIKLGIFVMGSLVFVPAVMCYAVKHFRGNK